MPWALTNSSCSSLRAAETLDRSTSLKVVSMAVEFFDSIRRSAMRLRMRVIGTRSSGRAPPAAGAAVAGEVDDVFLVTAPRRPVPSTSAGFTPSVMAVKRAPGGSASAADGSRGRRSGSGRSSGGRCGFSLLLFSGRGRSRSYGAFFDDRHDLAGGHGIAFLELDFLEHAVNRRRHFQDDLVGFQVKQVSSRLTASPTFLCQVAMVPSATDSGSTGALTSVAIAGASWFVF